MMTQAEIIAKLCKHSEALSEKLRDTMNRLPEEFNREPPTFHGKPHYVIEVDGELVPVNTLLWAAWLEIFREQRLVRQSRYDEIFVSTVLLGIDMSFGDGPPKYFETMVFGGPHNGFQDRYTTRDEALAGHRQALLMHAHDVAEWMDNKQENPHEDQGSSHSAPAPRP